MCRAKSHGIRPRGVAARPVRIQLGEIKAGRIQVGKELFLGCCDGPGVERGGLRGGMGFPDGAIGFGSQVGAIAGRSGVAFGDSCGDARSAGRRGGGSWGGLYRSLGRRPDRGPWVQPIAPIAMRREAPGDLDFEIDVRFRGR
jgi:hypothetical protein